MATYTPNYNLKKPALNDKIRIADFNGNADIIDGAMNDNATLIAQLKSDIGIVENTNTATHNISAGQYVIWKGSLYTASSAISSGATLSDANLTAVSGGGLNALNSNLGTKAAIFSTGSISANGSANIEVGRGRIYLLVCGGAYATGSMYIIFAWTAGSGRVQTVKANSAVTVSIDADRIVTIASTEGISYSFIDVGAFV